MTDENEVPDVSMRVVISRMVSIFVFGVMFVAIGVVTGNDAVLVGGALLAVYIVVGPIAVMLQRLQ